MAITALIVVFFLLLALDLLVLHQKGTVITNRKAALETAFWVGLALSFTLVVRYLYQTDWVENPNDLTPARAMTKYISGYLIELSLSIDNLFVIALIFSTFKIPKEYQFRALFWGIIGAVVLRGIMIGIGVTLISKVSWITYVLGVFLLYTAFKMIRQKEEGNDQRHDNNLSKFIEMTDYLDGEKFFTKENGKRIATPLFGALLVIEFTDVIFALDSIPAILAITTDSFLVFSSNIFAILGLRSMYFFLANMLEKFRYLKYSVFAILIFVGIKLITAHFVHLPEWFSLAFIGTALACGVLVSLRKDKAKLASESV
ncbi:MAG: TerC/Alx family metal homeostasis membrane protein [Bacteroidota bacterium]